MAKLRIKMIPARIIREKEVAVTPGRGPVHSCVIFGYGGKDLKILLVEKGIPPFKGMWELPGGYLQMEEDSIDGDLLKSKGFRLEF